MYMHTSYSLTWDFSYIYECLSSDCDTIVNGNNGSASVVGNFGKCQGAKVKQ